MTSMGENDCYLSQLSFHWLMNFDKQISPSQMLSIHIQPAQWPILLISLTNILSIRRLTPSEWRKYGEQIKLWTPKQTRLASHSTESI